MTDRTNLANLLNAHMKRASVGDARLASQVNAINGNEFFIHRSTLRNWRSGAVEKVQNWRQLATVAIALGLDENDANALLASGGCVPIQALRSTTEVTDQALLAHWHNTAPSAPEAPTENVDVPPQRNEPVKSGNPKKGMALPNAREKASRLKRNMAICSAAVLGLSALGFGFHNDNGRNLLENSGFDNGTKGWLSYVDEAAQANFSVVEGELHLQIDQLSDISWHIGLNQKDLEVTAGKFYTARFRVRGDGVTSMYVDITRVVEPRTSLSFNNSVQQKVITTSEWVVHTIEFEAVETVGEKDGGARLFFRFGKSEKGKIVLDDIELFEGKLEQEGSA